jgi:biotin transport system substrate-specific component
MLGTRTLAPSNRRTLARRIAAVVGGSVLMALAAHVAIPLPWSPVPLTGQTFALALLVGLLGTRGAVAALVLYLAEGAAGLPVLSPAAAGSMFGPTGGYLVAFPFAAFVTGWLFDRGLIRTYGGRVLAIAAGTGVVFAGGAAWLSAFTGPGAALVLGVVPFLAGDALKTLLAAAVVPRLRSPGRNT